MNKKTIYDITEFTDNLIELRLKICFANLALCCIANKVKALDFNEPTRTKNEEENKTTILSDSSTSTTINESTVFGNVFFKEVFPHAKLWLHEYRRHLIFDCLCNKLCTQTCTAIVKGDKNELYNERLDF